MSEFWYDSMKKAEREYKNHPTPPKLFDFIYQTMNYEKCSLESDQSNEADRIMTAVEHVQDKQKALLDEAEELFKNIAPKQFEILSTGGIREFPNPSVDRWLKKVEDMNNA